MFRQKSNSICLVIATVIVASVISSTAFAFDGHRKGFVMGLGLGGSPSVHWSASKFGLSGTESSWATGPLLGYSWNNANMLVLASDNYFSTENGEVYTTLLLRGVSWYHYYGATHRGFYTKFGIGHLYVGTKYFDIGGSGFGVVIGGGYEFSKHLQFGVAFARGSGSDRGSISASGRGISFMVSAIAY